MKGFHYAIASIVDANTGFGLVHGGNDRDTAAHERNARTIRARSIQAALRAARAAVGRAVDAYRKHARDRRELARLAQLNDHFLEDIGLTRGDVIAVQLGQVKLRELSESRRSRLAVPPLESVDSYRVEDEAATATAANENRYATAKCA